MMSLLHHLSPEDSDDESAVVRKDRKVAKGGLYQKTNTQSLNKPAGTVVLYVCVHCCVGLFVRWDDSCVNG